MNRFTPVWEEGGQGQGGHWIYYVSHARNVAHTSHAHARGNRLVCCAHFRLYFTHSCSCNCCLYVARMRGGTALLVSRKVFICPYPDSFSMCMHPESIDIRAYLDLFSICTYPDSIYIRPYPDLFSIGPYPDSIYIRPNPDLFSIGLYPG